MAVSLVLTAFLFGLPVVQYQTYNQDGVIKGREGIAYDKEQCAAVTLTEDVVTETILGVQKLFDNPDHVGYDGNEKFLIGDAYWNEIAPRENMLNMIAKTYDSPNESSGYNKLPDLDMTDGAKFYEARKSKIEKLLDTPSRELSEKQKAYWSRMAGKVHTPLQYGYYKGWEIIISSFELFMFAVLAVCIALAPVFSGEYQSGTDAVILSGRYGKTKLIKAKIMASYLFGLLAFTLHIAVAFGLLLSSVMKSPYPVLVVLVPVLFIPVFLTPDGTAGAYNLALFLLPYRAAMPEIGKYISYQFGGVVMDAFSVKAILYAMITVVMLPFAGMGFRRHQVA